MPIHYQEQELSLKEIASLASSLGIPLNKYEGENPLSLLSQYQVASALLQGYRELFNDNPETKTGYRNERMTLQSKPDGTDVIYKIQGSPNTLEASITEYYAQSAALRRLHGADLRRHEVTLFPPIHKNAKIIPAPISLLSPSTGKRTDIVTTSGVRQVLIHFATMKKAIRG